MLDIDTPHKTTAMESITEDDIANYLLKNPDFFERHAEVLASVQLSSPHGQRATKFARSKQGLSTWCAMAMKTSP
jgi:Protein of unknown function, DUF484